MSRLYHSNPKGVYIQDDNSYFAFSCRPLKQVKLTDPFWSCYIELVREVVIPYQYEALHDRIPGVEPSYGVSNFRIAAGREYGGMVFQDSDVAKWLEAAAYSLAIHPDPKLEEQVDELIDLVAAAQRGWLSEYIFYGKGAGEALDQSDGLP